MKRESKEEEKVNGKREKEIERKKERINKEWKKKK